jgi:hypothetical protein
MDVIAGSVLKGKRERKDGRGEGEKLASPPSFGLL